MTFLRSLHNQEPYKLRVVAEARELYERRVKLNEFLRNDLKTENLGGKEIALMFDQRNAMGLYLTALLNRLSLYSINHAIVFADRVEIVEHWERERNRGMVIQALSGDEWQTLEGGTNYPLNPVFYRAVDTLHET